MLNNIILEGTVTNNPEIIDIDNSTVQFTLCSVSKEDELTMPIIAWPDFGLKILKKIHEGMLIRVVGRLVTCTIDERKTVEIVANHIEWREGRKILSIKESQMSVSNNTKIQLNGAEKVFSIDLNGKKVEIKPLEIKYRVWWNHDTDLILTDKTPALGDDYGAGDFHSREVFYEKNFEDINKLMHYAEEDYLFWKDNTIYISSRLTDEVKESLLTEGEIRCYQALLRCVAEDLRSRLDAIFLKKGWHLIKVNSWRSQFYV